MTRPYCLAVLLIVGGGLSLAARSDPSPNGTVGAAKAPVLRTGVVPIGSLGLPLGAYVTIDGVRLDGGKVGTSTHRVDAVNGRKLPEPAAIWVDNLKLPKDTRCKLKGYESARMIGKPPAKFAAAKENGKDEPAPQAAWQVQLYFVALSVVEPQGLQVPDEGDAPDRSG